MIPMNLFAGQGEGRRQRELTHGRRGEGGRGVNWEVGTDTYTL